MKSHLVNGKISTVISWITWICIQPTFSKNNFELLVSTALQITKQASAENYPLSRIPQTWIFPLIWRNRVTNQQPLTSAQEDYSLYQKIKTPVIITQLNSTTYAGHENIYPYSREFVIEQITTPVAFGVLRYHLNYASIFIQNFNEEEQFNQIQHLVKYKYGRPHKDYFFFIGSGEGANNLETNFLRDIRYKIGIELLEPAVIRLSTNACEWNRKLPFFVRKCDAAIRNRNYIVSACNLPAMIRPETIANGKIENGGGMIYAMFLEASIRHNFTFSSHIAPFKGASGFKDKKGVWQGALGEVLRREADVAFAVGITVDRLKIADPTASQIRIERVFYIRSPPLKLSYLSIFWPLNAQLWVLIVLVTIVVVLPTFYLAAVAYFKSHASRGVMKPNYIFLQVLDAIYRILMEQAATVRDWNGTHIRILIILWTMFCLIIETGYRTKLVSFLTFLEHEDVPRTHEDLMLSDFKLYFRFYGGVAYQYAAGSNSSMHKRMISKIELINHSHECIEKALLVPNSACLDYSLSGDFAIATNSTLYLNQIKELFIKSIDTDFKSTIVWAFRKGSPFTESFTEVVLNYLAAGLFERWKSIDFALNRAAGIKWLKACNGSKEIKAKIMDILSILTIGPKKLEFGNLSGMFVIFGIGSAISLFVWLCELVVGKWVNQRVQKIS